LARYLETTTAHEKKNADQHWSIGISGADLLSRSQKLQPCFVDLECQFPIHKQREAYHLLTH